MALDENLMRQETETRRAWRAWQHRRVQRPPRVTDLLAGTWCWRITRAKVAKDIYAMKLTIGGRRCHERFAKPNEAAIAPLSAFAP
jgi:hypothetical protein